MINNTIRAEVIEIEKKSFEKEKFLYLNGFIPHHINYHTSCVFTVVFTACSLRVHCVFIACSLRTNSGRRRRRRRSVVAVGRRRRSSVGRSFRLSVGVIVRRSSFVGVVVVGRS